MFGLTLQAQWSQTEEYKKQLGKYVKTYSMDGLTRNMQLDALDFNFGYHGSLFGEELNATKKKEKAKLLEKVIKAAKEIEEIEKGNVYEDAFEWRFEFPEVLDDEGNFVGFDVVIGNPPYIGEKGHKEIFRPLKQVYQDRYESNADLFYFFFMKSIDILREDGIFGFITTNYFLTADGAIKMRQELQDRTAIYNLINFNEMKIFESAQGQHNIITMFQKTTNLLDTNIINILTPTIENDKLFTVDNDDVEQFISNSFDIYDGKKKYIRTSKQGNILDDVFSKMTNDARYINEICLLGVGFKTGTDKVDKKDIEKVYSIKPENINLKDGVFILTHNEYIKIQPEEELVHKCYKSSDIEKYISDNWKNLYVIWTNKDTNINNYPNIKRHLERYRKILEFKMKDRGETLPWYSNYRAREYDLFTNKDKIVFPYRSKENIFSYSDDDYFASGDILYMRQKNKAFHMKYLISLLNSKLYYTWLYYKGKRKGEILELYVTPVGQVPIKNISLEQQQPFITLADKIITLKKQNQDTTELEAQIDQMVYELYGLSEDEVALVEGEQ